MSYANSHTKKSRKNDIASRFFFLHRLAIFFCIVLSSQRRALISFGSVARRFSSLRIQKHTLTQTQIDRKTKKKTKTFKTYRYTLILNLSLAFIKNLIIQFENSSFVFSPFKLIKSQTILEREKETNSSFFFEKWKKNKDKNCVVRERGTGRKRLRSSFQMKRSGTLRSKSNDAI